MKRFFTVLFLAVLTFCWSCSLWAVVLVSKRTFSQDSAFKFDESIFDLTVQTKLGSPYSEKVVNDDVKRLAARGDFADVSVSIKQVDNGNVEVTFHLVANPLIEAVKFEGNYKIPDDKLRPQIKFSLHTPRNDALVMETADAIREMYKAANREQTKVSPDFIKNPNGSLTLLFRIDEESRIRIMNVEFEGNTVYSASELSDAMESRYSPASVSWLEWLPVEDRPGLFKEAAIERDRMRLRELYLRKGYLDFKIKSIKTTPVDNDPEKVNVLFVLEEGEPYYVGKVRLTGVTVFPEDDVRKLIKLLPDNMYNVLTEQEDQFRIENLYAPEGYADFRIDVVRTPNYRTHTVDLDYVLHEGPQYTIGEIMISGNKWTKPHVILRELPFKPDEKVDTRKIKIAKQRLMGMNYFETMKEGDNIGPGVDITTFNSEQPGKKDINIEVREKRFITGTIGGGWSDSDGIAGMIELSHTNMDILDPANYFTGGGQKLRIYGLIGTERRDAVVDFTEPWLFGIPLRWNINGYWRENVYEDWKDTRIGFTTSLTKRVFDDFTSIQLGYTFEQVKIHGMDKDMGPVFQEQEGKYRNGRVFVNVERDTRDSFSDPRHGYDVGVYAGLTTKGLGATDNFFKVELKGMGHYSFFHDWFTLSVGGKLGMMKGFGGTDFVPLWDRYFLGGGDSIRGFPYRSIGPEDENKDCYGGEFMWVVTTELSHPIYKDYIRGAFFCDVGDATKDIFRFEAPNVGIGYGLRIKLPQCPMPLRLDLAYPVVNNQKGVASRLRFHFNLGIAF